MRTCRLTEVTLYYSFPVNCEVLQYEYKCDIARRQPVCYIWRGICSSWRIPQTRGAMRHITRGSAMPAILCSKICLGERNRKINAHGHHTKNIFYIVQILNTFIQISMLRVL